MVDGASAVRLRGVSKRYGDVVAVDGIDLDLADGEFFSMLGPSGSGKTTTLRMIAGFEAPTTGTVELHGEDVSGPPAYDRDVNTVFQDYALFPHMTVGQNVGYGLLVKRVGRAERAERVRAALAEVRLGGFEGRKPSQLSGGQRQRVALARALVNRPRVLLLDEPLGALDLKLREELQLELKRIQRDVGITFVYVTHDQSEALTMSDRIAVFNAGRIEQVGTPADVYEHPADRLRGGLRRDLEPPRAARPRGRWWGRRGPSASAPRRSGSTTAAPSARMPGRASPTAGSTRSSTSGRRPATTSPWRRAASSSSPSRTPRARRWRRSRQRGREVTLGWERRHNLRVGESGKQRGRDEA